MTMASLMPKGSDHATVHPCETRRADGADNTVSNSEW